MPVILLSQTARMIDAFTSCRCLRAAWQLLLSPGSLTCTSPFHLPQLDARHPECAAGSAAISAAHFVRMSVPQMSNLVLLHGTLWCMNFRSRRSGERAARQEEAFLAVLIALAVTNLIYSIAPGNASDYIYAVFFLICCASYLKIRWWVGMAALAFPTTAALVRPHPHPSFRRRAHKAHPSQAFS